MKGLLMLGKEATSGVIDLPEDEPEIIKLFIQYLYEAEYNPVPPTGGQDTSVAAPPREPGYQYDFPHTCQSGYVDWDFMTVYLKCVKLKVCPHHNCIMPSCSCRGSFSCKICTAPPSLPLPRPVGTAEDLLLHTKMYEIGDKYEVIGLKDLAKDKFKASCKRFWNTSSFAIAARHAFSTTVEDDKGLRDIVSTTISEHLELVDDPEVRAVMTEFNGLALGILLATIGKRYEPTSQRC
jgi:hypothetical protein